VTKEKAKMKKREEDAGMDGRRAESVKEDEG
jgi:hypothetical protein